MVGMTDFVIVLMGNILPVCHSNEGMSVVPGVREEEMRILILILTEHYLIVPSRRSFEDRPHDNRDRWKFPTKQNQRHVTV